MPTPRLLLALVVLLTTVACASPADIAAPGARAANLLPGPRLPIPPVVVASPERFLLEQLSKDLLYTSESDYPFVYFRVTRDQDAAPTAALSIAEFRALLDIPPETHVEVVTLDRFFARHIELVDPSDEVFQALIPRFVTLRDTLRTSFAYTQVYRVGNILIDCYVVGFDSMGNLVGLTTISVET